MEFLSMLFFFLVIVPSAILHEYAHAWMADQLGDPTAKYAGRLSLNPKVHIDKWGTIFMPLILIVITGGKFLFAYAKPVPYNPYNLKDQKWGPALVAVAGPLANLFLAFSFGLIIKFIPFSFSILSLLYVVVYANVLLAIFNLVPIPPLDGSKILSAILPDSMWQVKQFLQKYSLFILFFFIFFGFELIMPIVNFLTSLFI